MNQIGKTLLLIAIVGAGFHARAVTPDNRYNTIVDRNIFRLTSPPPPPVVEGPKDPALDRNIELSGITKVNGRQKAWFIVKEKGAKDSLYLELGVDEEKDALKVLNISEEAGEVKILNSGNSMVLSFKNNSPKALPSAVPPPALGAAATAGKITPLPNAYTSTTPSSRGSSSRSAVTVAGGTPTATATPTTQFGQTAQTSSGLRTIPTRPVRMDQQQSTAHSEPMDPREQLRRLHIGKEVYNAAGVEFPPIPGDVNNSGTAPVNGGPPTPR